MRLLSTKNTSVVIVARLGGYLNRPSDPPPGPKVMCIGLAKLGGMVEGYRMAHAQGP